MQVNKCWFSKARYGGEAVTRDPWCPLANQHHLTNERSGLKNKTITKQAKAKASEMVFAIKPVGLSLIPGVHIVEEQPTLS